VTAEIEVRAEQVRTLYRQGTAVVVSSFVVSLIVTAVLLHSAPWPWLFALPGALLVIGLVRVAFGRRYFHESPPADQAMVWARRFVTGSACSGSVWGVAGFTLFDSPNPLAAFVVPFAVGGLSAAAAGTVSCYLPAFFAFVVPALGGVLARALFVGDAPHLAVAAMIGVYGPSLSYIAVVSHRALRDALRFRFENEVLLVELEAARKRLEESNRTLEQRVEERSRELEQKADALRDAQRMEAVGRLAGGIAHDFNNLLMVVLGNVSDLIQKRGSALPPDTRLTEARDAAARGAELVKQLLLFSRRQESRPETLDLNQVVAAMQRLLVRLIGEHLTLDVRLSEAPLFVSMDRTQLEQIIINLVTNARDAMNAGGVVAVETERVDLVQPEDEVAPGSYARLRVSDTGVGMDSETRRRLFEPFFTTKDVGRGTGLGLATVYGIVEQCGGAIRVESESRHGSRFSIYFPRTAARAAATRPSAPAPAGAGPSATILLVEDDPGVRGVANRMLTRAGHSVLIAEDPERALAVAAAHPDSIDVLITDVVMPKLSGPDLSERLRELRPNLRTLFMSGYNRGHLVPAEDESKGVLFLEKPFTYEALVKKVAALVALPSIARESQSEPRRA
jgi:signal transduction histidine kinase